MFPQTKEAELTSKALRQAIAHLAIRLQEQVLHQGLLRLQEVTIAIHPQGQHRATHPLVAVEARILQVLHQEALALQDLQEVVEVDQEVDDKI